MEVSKWPRLHKRTSTGKVVEWDIRVITEPETPDDWDAVGHGPVIRVVHGQHGGKKQTADVIVRTGKNLGKANATTAEEQACLEAEARWRKQLDKGYSENLAGGDMAYKPMLAHKYEDCKDKVVFPCFVQPKLDGVRAIARKEGGVVTLWSRQGKEHKGLGHVKLALRDVLKDGDAFDGELYVHGMPFQTLVSLVKKDQCDSRKVQYHVYDCVRDGEFYLRHGHYMKRYASALCQFSSGHLEPVKVVDTTVANSAEEVEDAHQLAVANGYEGVMLRTGACPYKPGYRSRELLKVKAFRDGEFKIVDVVDGVGKAAGQAIFVCETEEGERFQARPKGRDELRREYFENKEKYAGKLLTVRYFAMTDSERPVPRFPVGVSVRDYE